jgi:hypothetical protein
MREKNTSNALTRCRVLSEISILDRKLKSRSSQQALGTKQAGSAGLQSNEFMQTSGLGNSDLRVSKRSQKPAMFRIAHIERQHSAALEVCQMVGHEVASGPVV